MKYGLLKKKIMSDLKAELDEFIDALEIYLTEFASVDDISPIKQIQDINATHLISFNYTKTESLYGISEDHVHHIHGGIGGKIEKEDPESKSNMVLGVNEQKDKKMDFIYFIKYFQRIQKHCGTQYKRFVSVEYEVEDSLEKAIMPFYLHIYGHSLDVTDEDILKYAIGDFDGNNMFKLKPKQVIIYYYDQEDYEKKVISLVNLYGRSIVEEYMENDEFHFEKCKGERI